jgi:Na+-translocating ferredoxin:NAD+ oxidoreductase subunit E
VSAAKDPATAYAEFIKGVWKENPVLVQVLGMCPALAVTNSAINAVAMGGASLFVLLGSSLLVSLLRKLIARQVRISVFIIIIATFVTIADYALKAAVPDVHKELGAFIPLIVANCLILGRQEAFASKNGPLKAVSDAAGMGLGFLVAMFLLGAVREVLGSGTLFGVMLFGPNFEPWVLMILPPGGFLTLGVLLLGLNWWGERRKRAPTASAADAERRAA